MKPGSTVEESEPTDMVGDKIRKSKTRTGTSTSETNCVIGLSGTVLGLLS